MGVLSFAFCSQAGASLPHDWIAHRQQASRSSEANALSPPSTRTQGNYPPSHSCPSPFHTHAHKHTGGRRASLFSIEEPPSQQHHPGGHIRAGPLDVRCPRPPSAASSPVTLHASLHTITITIDRRGLEAVHSHAPPHKQHTTNHHLPWETPTRPNARALPPTL